MLAWVHHVVGGLAFELNWSRNFTDFSGPQPDAGFQNRQDKCHPRGELGSLDGFVQLRHGQGREGWTVLD